METDIFLCYRRTGAQTAKLFKRYLESMQFGGKVWYSDDEIYGNYKFDIPELIQTAKCAVLFVDKNFTKNFIENEQEYECITALEIIEIEKRLQSDEKFRIFLVALDCKGFSLEAQNDLSVLFERANICTERSVAHFAQSNVISFETAKDDEYVLFERLSQELLLDVMLKRNPIKGNFYFGKRGTMADVIVWDVENGISGNDISFELSEETIALHRKIENIRFSQSHEIQNNQMISLTYLDVNLSDNEEKKSIVIQYLPIKYRLFQKTLRIWNVAGLNLGQKVNQYTIEKGKYEIPNAMGLAFMVITSDNQLIFTKRSSKRAIRPNEYDCSIVEGLKIEVVSELYGDYDIFDEEYVNKEIHRAYREEMCPHDENLEIKITGIVLDKEYGQWNIVGIIRTPESAEDLIRRHSVRSDTYEYIHMRAVPFYDSEGNKTLVHLKKMFPEFIKYKMWGMGFVVLYAALIELGFKETEIDEVSVGF